MIELTLHKIKKYKESTLILTDVSLQVQTNEKVGIVGANGSGKTTLMKLIAGIEKLECFSGYPQTSAPGYDEGIITFSSNQRVAYLEQIPKYEKALKVIDVLNLAFSELKHIELQMRELETQMQSNTSEITMKKYSALLQQFELLDGYQQEEKLNRICKGLNFNDEFLNKDFELLSGGEKTKVLLGKLLMENPEILLLDEPTNHLDMDAIEWLENYLKNYKGIVLIVSHDRYFLDQVVTKIVEIEDGESITYLGNYTSFMNQKEGAIRIQLEQFKDQQKKIHAMEQAIKDLRQWAIQADNNKFFRRAASMQKRLDKMDRIDKPKTENQNMNLQIKTNSRSGYETIKINQMYKSYEEKQLFKNADALVKYGESVALIGPNGSGKTTLLRMLLQEETPDAGLVTFGSSVKFAYLPQDIYFPNEELTVVDCFREDFYLEVGRAREHLSKYMFYGNSVFKKVKHLSGGERIRLKLAQLLYNEVNLLLLDEPTNHLDIESIETLEEALEDFKGTIFIISHDRYFINKRCERILSIENQQLRSYDGNYDYYRSIKEKEMMKEVMKEEIKDVSTKKIKPVNNEKQREIELKRIEKQMGILEEELKKIEELMNIHAFDYNKLNELYIQKDEIQTKLDERMNEWIELHD